MALVVGCCWFVWLVLLVKDISNLFSHRVDSRSSNARDRSLVKRRLSWYIAECSSPFYDLVVPVPISGSKDFVYLCL